jgi:hypothetical protein
MKAISTKYHGPSNTRGSRITADDGDGNRITVSYDHSASMGAEVHSKAAIALCRKMNWDGELIAGATDKGYVFVFSNSERFPIAETR